VLQTTAGKMIFGRYLDPSQVSQSGTHGDERPRSRSQVASGAHAVTPGSTPGAPAASVPAAVPAAGAAAVPVVEPAPRAATPAAGK
jgi:hypothetical protein